MELTDKQVKDHCRLGQGVKCCAFLMMAPTGWACAKNDPIVFSTIKRRLEKRTMNAKGTGDWEDCPFNSGSSQDPDERSKCCSDCDHYTSGHANYDDGGMCTELDQACNGDDGADYCELFKE